MINRILKIEEQRQEKCEDQNKLSLLSSTMELNESTTTEDDQDNDDSGGENEDQEDCDTTDSGAIKKTHDSGFVDVSDEKEDKKGIRSSYNFTSTPLRPQNNNGRRLSSTSSTTSNHRLLSDIKLDDKECRNTRFLGSKAVSILNKWFHSNRDYPYPDDEKTDKLAFEAGITQKQVKKWFANKRVRSQLCYKPLYRSRKSRTSHSFNPVSTSARSPILPLPPAHHQPPPPPHTNYNYIINHNNITHPNYGNSHHQDHYGTTTQFQNLFSLPSLPFLQTSPLLPTNPFHLNPMMMNPFAMMMMMNPVYAQQVMSSMAASSMAALQQQQQQQQQHLTKHNKQQIAPTGTGNATASPSSIRFWM